ncbi:alpha/beta hydrolase [Salibacterium salarium]|uniref:Alpha/beta hydrolase n=2 Tax=Salibacterium salarium TaxID=284579 RepID=A0A3R9Q4K0_9BACI|nr:alpha/beta hydrolase [Salibacterium salarium]
MTIIFAVITAWSIERWSQTAHGQLPSKTAVVLHAINNNLVSLDANIEAPDFLSPDSSSNDKVMKKHDTSISVGKSNEIPVRIYHYSDVEDAPVIMYYHGGAFLEGYGSLESHDSLIRSLAAKTGAVVVSPGYRVAPEYIFPTAVEDSYKALKWAHDNAEKYGGNPDKMGVAGDSAGGNLAAVTALKSRDLNGPDLFAQVLYYPLTTFRDVEFDSRTMYDSGYYLLSKQVMMKARSSYTPKESMWENPYTSPLNANDLSDLPPAHIITAQFDPLRDEGELYGEKLHEAGVPVNTVRYNGVMHGFVSFYEVMGSGNMALQESAQFLKKADDETPQPSKNYELRIEEGSSGFKHFKEEAEAFAIGAFLVGKSIMNLLTKK